MSAGNVAVITGASRGLGRAFAEAVAAKGMDLVLTSLPGEGLTELARELAASRGIDILALELDLSIPSELEGLVEAIRSRARPVKLLINNAGIAVNGYFDRIPGEIHQKTVDLNIQAAMGLCYGLLPLLKAAAPARIVTVASLAAFQPMPLFSVYGASKAFLMHWSLALREELKPLGIGVTVLAPGGIYTSPEIREKARSQGFLGRLSTLEPETVAAAALSASERGRALAIPGWFNRILAGLGALVSDSLKARAVLRRWEKALSRLAAAPDRDYCVRRGNGREAA